MTSRGRGALGDVSGRTTPGENAFWPHAQEGNGSGAHGSSLKLKEEASYTSSVQILLMAQQLTWNKMPLFFCFFLFFLFSLSHFGNQKFVLYVCESVSLLQTSSFV